MDAGIYTEELLTDLQEFQNDIAGIEDIKKKIKKPENIKEKAEKQFTERTVEEQIKENEDLEMLFEELQKHLIPTNYLYEIEP